MNLVETLKPKDLKALDISFWLMLPERSTSKAWKQRFQSSIYFHNPENSLKLIVPLLSTQTHTQS